MILYKCSIQVNMFIRQSFYNPLFHSGHSAIFTKRKPGLFGFNKQLRYRESIIEIGERITVAGYVKWVELEQPVSDYNYSRVATLVAKDKNKILITDATEALKPKHNR